MSPPDHGSNYGSATAVHSLTLYRAASRALVFGAGTVQWSWGLDRNHDRGNLDPDVRMQQATVNLLADMEVAPQTLQAGLVIATASADAVAPMSTVTFPTSGASVSSGTEVTITGTASDSGGLVAAVEVSTDGGSTWRPATGRTSWSYRWTPSALGPVSIRSRALDDSANLETPGSGVTVNVTGRTCPCSIWSGTTTPNWQDSDTNAVELGVKFRSDSAGSITALRFYKYSTDTGTHTGNLWTATGTRLATVTFTNETASGWQQVSLPTPVAIAANTTYIASYHTSVGRYAVSSPYFAAAGVDNAPLHALRDGVDGGNGVYRYGATSLFPNQTYNASNYWVDIVFTTSGPETTPPTVASVSPAAGASGVNVTADVTATFSEAMNAATITTTTVELRDSANALIPAVVTYAAGTATAILNPSAALAYSTMYTTRIRGGSTDPRVKDQAGNALAADFSWSFTTAAPPPEGASITIADASVSEGNAGAASATFTVSLSGSSGGTVTVAYATANGTAAAPGDYATTSDTLTFAPGVTTQTITVSVIGDTLDEANETFQVNLSSPTGATLADAQGVGTITDDDPLPSMSIGDVTVTEGDTGTLNATFTVTLSSVSGRVVTVAYTTANGTAIAGSDYAAASGTVTFAIGTATQTVNVSVTGDVVDESDETFFVNLSAPSNATLADAQGSGVIIDNDSSVGPTCPCSIWSGTATPDWQDSDTNAVELGVKFRSDSAGSITALRFYKYSTNTGTHTGNLWTTTGTRLATVTFTNETASGWQQVSLPTPVAIAANTTYIASYHTSVGRYAVSSPYFAAAGVDNAPLHALRDGVDGGNGVYRYGATSVFPNQTYNASNYWVDVVFTTSGP